MRSDGEEHGEGRFASVVRAGTARRGSSGASPERAAGGRPRGFWMQAAIEYLSTVVFIFIHRVGRVAGGRRPAPSDPGQPAAPRAARAARPNPGHSASDAASRILSGSLMHSPQ